MSIDQIEHNLEDQNLILFHAMRIAAQLDAGDADISSEDTAFLTIARDRLNGRAAPATGSSISFTVRVVDKLRGNKPDSDVPRRQASYLIPDKSLEAVAAESASFVNCCITSLRRLLLLVFVVSTYVACGKLLLDTQDAANKDFGANMSSIAAEVNRYDQIAQAFGKQFDQDAPKGARPDDRYRDKSGFVDDFCEKHAADILVQDSCYQRAGVVVRKQNIHNLLAYWTIIYWTLAEERSGEKMEQYAATTVGVAGNFVLPVLYGALGSFGFVLRRLNRQLADYRLMPRDLRANQIRVMLGIVTGACIGLFVNAPTSTATLTGFGGAVVTLSASGVAFLAGYGVEGVFKMLDAFINHVFRSNEEPAGGTPR